MNTLVRRVQRLIACRGYATARNVWTADKVVISPFPDVEIPNITLSEYVWRDLDKWADKTAVVCGLTNRSYTYYQLFNYASTFAATLRKQFKIEDGDVIGIMMHNSPEYVLAILGAAQSGAVTTTVNPIYTAHEVYRQLLHSKPKLIIAAPETLQVIKDALNAAETSIPIILVNNPNKSLPDNTISFEELIRNDTIDKSVLKNVRTTAEDVVLLPYSSGTTGLPKGVELTNRNKVANFLQQQVDGIKHFYDTTSNYQDSILAVLPFYHLYGLSIIMLHKLTIGAKIVTLPRFKPDTFLKALKEYKISLLYTAPPLALFLGSNPEVTKEHLGSVDRVVCAAAPVAKSDIERVREKCQPDMKFLQLYGLTELSPIVTLMELEGHNYETAGYALPNSQIKVVDPNGCNLGPDEVGELLIRGPHVMKGYRDNPEATRETISDDGWFKSGDLVSIDKDGAVTIVDRIKELIKVKGYQVPPAELEGILREHPDVLEAAVIGIPDERKGEAPKAFVVLKDGRKANSKDIKEFVSQRVAEFKRLKEVEFVDSIPKNPSGKLLRRMLRKK